MGGSDSGWWATNNGQAGRRRSKATRLDRAEPMNFPSHTFFVLARRCKFLVRNLD
jgi:hypothetical protein